MTAIAAAGARIGFEVLRKYFCKSIERGDYTNDQVLEVFENKLNVLIKDLEVLKLQKLKSGIFLLKTGVIVSTAGDVKEGIRNLDKAELDAIEGFSTAPTPEWKIIAVKVTLCSIIWRKMIIVPVTNLSSVVKQLQLNLSRLIEDPSIRNNIITHCKGSIKSIFNKQKRLELIEKVVEIEDFVRIFLFQNFLEILPPSIIIDDESSISLAALSKVTTEFAPFSPRQCASFTDVHAAKSWSNISCNIVDGPGISEMTSKAIDNKDTVIYLAHKQWMNLQQQLRNGNGVIKQFDNPRFGEISLLDFKLVFVSVSLIFTSVDASHPTIKMAIDDHYFKCENFSDRLMGGGNHLLTYYFHIGHPFIEELHNIITTDLKLSSTPLISILAHNDSTFINCLSFVCHLKFKNIVYQTPISLLPEISAFDAKSS